MSAAIARASPDSSRPIAPVRAPAPLSALSVGLKCGGSDGFSGHLGQSGDRAHVRSAVGARRHHAARRVSRTARVGAGAGVERCVRPELAERFIDLMQAYDAQARAVGSGFEMNPSPGNIRDGLLTDAMKSAGAARKGGTAPVTDVLDYPGARHDTGPQPALHARQRRRVHHGAGRGRRQHHSVHHRPRHADRQPGRAGAQARHQLGARAPDAGHRGFRLRRRGLAARRRSPRWANGFSTW